MASDELDQTIDSGTSAPRGTLAPGAHIGKYRLDRVLGEGGMGQVWAAHDPDLDRAVAIKVLRAADAPAALRTRLLREARAMARLKHPNVLTVYEVGSEGDRDYIAMELVDGTNLDRWLAAGPPAKEVWEAVLAAGRGLAAAHDAGLVHRDFKPHNVLRSRDGRVLVTDFGLARGIAEEGAIATGAARATSGIALETTLDATTTPRHDPVLDTPLTQTGALLGTPAYMSPEQFLGSTPDARSDQFAFCVTAWQALSGERPFKGATLEEMARAIAAGVDGVRAKLPGGVRAVLARGLERDPDRRWPTMDTLLVALERAGTPRRPWRFVFPAFGIAGAIVLLVAMRHKDARVAPPTPAAYACESPEKAISEAWTPERSKALERRVGKTASVVADALDQLRAQWIDSYTKTCAQPASPKALARLGCLLGERDELAAFSRLADTLPLAAFESLDMWGVLPRVDACEIDSPAVPPLLPDDRKLRDKIVALRAEIAALRLRDPQELLDKANDFARAAHALGWEPLEAELDEAVGAAAHVLGRFEEARTKLAAAAEHAERLHDYRLEATARIALLETESEETGDPSDPQREQKLVDAARAAVRRAADDPELVGSIDVILANTRLSRGDRSSVEDLLKKTWWDAPKGGIHVESLRDVALMRLRMLQGDYEEAWVLGQDHEREHPQGGRVHAEIEKQMIEAAWRRGDLEAVHTRATGTPVFETAKGTVLVDGTVTDAHGQPVVGARIVTWKGTLRGDARRLFTRVDFTGMEIFSKKNGSFSGIAPIGGAMIAEHDDLRSAPVAVPDGHAITLVLAPTHAVAGKTIGTPVAADAFVEIDVGNAQWLDRAPVASDHTYRIAGIPAAREATLGLAGALDRAGRTVPLGHARDGATLAWPAGPTLDVITHRSGNVAIVRGHARPTSKTEIRSTGDVAHATVGPIGFSSLTPEGQKVYQRGDQHAVLRDIAPGLVSVCVFGTGAPACTDVTVPAGSGAVPVILR